MYQTKDKTMAKLENLLNENLERVDSKLWAEWLDDTKSYKDEETVKGMLRNLKLTHLEKELLEAEEAGLVRLVVDDRALLVELLK